MIDPTLELHNGVFCYLTTQAGVLLDLIGQKQID